MPIYKPFAIVKVPFPFSDKNVVKKRPALVLSKPLYQEKLNHCILAMITSAHNASWPDDVIIQNLELAGLSSPSVIRFKLFTLDERLIISQIGNLDAQEQRHVHHNLETYLIGPLSCS